MSLAFIIFGAAYVAVTFHKGEESKKSEDPNDKNSGSKESRNPHNEDSAIAEPVAGNSEQQNAGNGLVVDPAFGNSEPDETNIAEPASNLGYNEQKDTPSIEMGIMTDQLAINNWK